MIFFALWKWEFIVAVSCSLPSRLKEPLPQGFLFLCCQGRHLLLDHNTMNRVLVEHKGSVKGNVFLTSHSIGTWKRLMVA